MQDAYGTPGSYQDIGVSERTILDVVGWTLAAVSSTKPALKIVRSGANQFTLSWTNTATGYMLQERTNLYARFLDILHHRHDQPGGAGDHQYPEILPALQVRLLGVAAKCSSHCSGGTGRLQNRDPHPPAAPALTGSGMQLETARNGRCGSRPDQDAVEALLVGGVGGRSGKTNWSPGCW